MLKDKAEEKSSVKKLSSNLNFVKKTKSIKRSQNFEAEGLVIKNGWLNFN